MDSKTLVLDNVTYTLHPANAFDAWGVLKGVLGILKDVDLSTLVSEYQGVDGQQSDNTLMKLGTFLLSTMAGRLGDPAMQKVEDLVLKNVVAEVSGEKPYKVIHQLDLHFNQYRGHLLPLLFEGVKFQFSDFFTGGGGFVKAMMR